MKKVPVRRTGAYRQKKSTGIVANRVDNVIAAMLTYQLPTMFVQFMTKFLIILLNDLSFPSNDVGHVRHLDHHCYVPWREVAADVRENFWGRFLYGVYRPGELLWTDSNGKNGN